MSKFRYYLIGSALIGLIGIALVVWWPYDRKLDEVRTEQTANQPQKSTLVGSPSGRGLSSSSGSNSVTNQASPRPSLREHYGTLEKYLETEFPGEWKYIHAPDGRVMSISGLIPRAGESPDSAKALARELAPFLGLKESQFEVIPVAPPTVTELSVVYNYETSAYGYVILDSRITVFSRRSDNSVFMVNTGVSPPDPVDLDQSIDQAGARRVIEQHFTGSTLKFGTDPVRPLIWASSNPHELVWDFSVEILSPKPDHVRLMVGAHSGEIRFERSVRVQ